MSGLKAKLNKIPGGNIVGNVAGGAVGAVGGIANAATNTAGAAFNTVTLNQFGDEKEKYDPYKYAGAWQPEESKKEEEPEPEAPTHVTFLEYYLKDKFFGDWYHNAAVIFVTSFSSWLVARFGGGMVWIAVIMAFTSTYYRTSILRLRRNVRDDLARESALKRLESNTETMEWLNSFLVKFWAIYLPSLNQMVIETANQVLSGTQTPTPIDGLELKRFTLGTKPPRIDLVRTYPKTEDDIVVMDWGFSFIPNDVEDLTARQLKNKINPLVELSVRIGKGVVSKGMPILLQDMAFKGLIQVKIKLISNFPHIQTVNISFLTEPYFDFVLKPIGGETLGFDINFIPGLESFIKSMVHDTLRPQFYDPNTFAINVEQMLAGEPNDAARGVLALTIHNARGLKAGDMIGNTCDPYVRIATSQDPDKELARTKFKRDTVTPKWNETHLVLINSLSELLTLDIFDFNDIRKDKLLGSASFDLSTLENEPEQQNIAGQVISNARPRGEIFFDATYFPVLSGKTLDDGSKEPPPQLNTGIIRFTVNQVKDIPRKNPSMFAEYYINGKLVYTTRTLKRMATPIWDEAYEHLISNKRGTVVSVVIKDDSIGGESIVGTYKAALEDILNKIDAGDDWFNLKPSGRIRLSSLWKPVALKGIVASGGYINPIGVLRFHLKSATDLRNLETIGKVDPYVRIMVNNYQKNRTVTIHNELNPNWDEFVYATITSPTEKIILEVMDQETNGKDRTLGETVVDISDLVKKNTAGEYVELIDTSDRTGALTINRKSPKGSLVYNVSFFPTMNIMDPEDIKREEEEKKAAEEEAAAAAAEATTNGNTKTDAKDATSVNSKDSKQGVAEMGKLDEPEPPKIKMGIEELIKHETGLLIFRIIEGQFPKNDVYIQVFFDDLLYPSYLTSKSQGKRTKFEEVGDGIIRELDFSKIIIRATTKERGLRDDNEGVIASVEGSTLAHLQKGFHNPSVIDLLNKDGETVCQIKMSFKYIPIVMELDPAESRNNQGFVKVYVLDATDLPAADRRNRSDPYCIFELNGEQVFKSKVIKKTLTPAWNEMFDCVVPSLSKAHFVVNVYDWDMGPADDDFLGTATIDLSTLKPMETDTRIIPLQGKSGQIRLQLVFKPEYVLRAIKGETLLSGTFAVPGRVVTSVAGAPIKGIGFAAGGVAKGASFIRHGFKSKHHHNNDDAASIMTSTTSRRS
ncbi:C2 domain-containing protein [Dipodascopsis uninucleata]